MNIEDITAQNVIDETTAKYRKSVLFLSSLLIVVSIFPNLVNDFQFFGMKPGKTVYIVGIFILGYFSWVYFSSWLFHLYDFKAKLKGTINIHFRAIGPEGKDYKDLNDNDWAITSDIRKTLWDEIAAKDFIWVKIFLPTPLRKLFFIKGKFEQSHPVKVGTVVFTAPYKKDFLLIAGPISRDNLYKVQWRLRDLLFDFWLPFSLTALAGIKLLSIIFYSD